MCDPEEISLVALMVKRSRTAYIDLETMKAMTMPGDAEA